MDREPPELAYPKVCRIFQPHEMGRCCSSWSSSVRDEEYRKLFVEDLIIQATTNTSKHPHVLFWVDEIRNGMLTNLMAPYIRGFSMPKKSNEIVQQPVELVLPIMVSSSLKEVRL